MSAPLGLMACGLSSVFFGSMFVPVKKFDPGNGIFVQWVMSTSILLVGILVNVFQAFPPFHPLAMLGGMFWALGNSTAVPIMNELGVGLGMLIWGVTNCFMGWASGRFGLFGLKATIPASPLLNYLGLVFVIFGGFLFSNVKPTPKNVSSYDEINTVVDIRSTNPDNGEGSPLIEGRTSSPQPINRQKRRVTAIVTSLFAGLLYGVTFVPVIYMQDHPELYPDASASGLSYVFAHYCGIFCTATVLFVGHILYSGNNPTINTRIAGPSLLAGSLWGVAQSSWFVANDNLSQAVTFPIIAMVPGVCAALWSVLYFKEISGRKNLRLLCIAVAVTLSGAILVGVSK